MVTEKDRYHLLLQRSIVQVLSRINNVIQQFTTIQNTQVTNINQVTNIINNVTTNGTGGLPPRPPIGPIFSLENGTLALPEDETGTGPIFEGRPDLGRIFDNATIALPEDEEGAGGGGISPPEDDGGISEPLGGGGIAP